MRKLLLVLLLLPSCADDPVAVSEAVGINIDIKSDEVATGAISDEKDINSEAGNPYKAFITEARAALGGVDPSEVDLTAVTLSLGATSTGVTDLEQVFTGQVEILFIIHDTNNSYNVATVTNPTGGGPVSMNITWDPSLIKASSIDWGKFLDDKFKVVIRGTAATGFAEAAATAKMQVTLTFHAI
jgi:hypothetical protein